MPLRIPLLHMRTGPISSSKRIPPRNLAIELACAALHEPRFSLPNFRRGPHALPRFRAGEAVAAGDSLRTLKGRQLPKKSLFFSLPVATREESPEKLPSPFTAPPSPFLPAIKSPVPPPCSHRQFHFLSVQKIKETFREKGGRRQEARRGEVSLPCSASRPGSAVLPTCAHGRRGGVGSVCGPAAHAGAGAGGCAGGQAGEARDGAGGGLLRRLPALRRRLPSRVRPPCQATHLSPFRASPFLTPDSENQLTDRLLIASVD
jgi:hypothetical protein